ASSTEACCAWTKIWFPRAEVAEKHGLRRDARVGFRMLGKISPAVADARDITLRIVASWNGETSETFAEQNVRLIPARLRERPYGDVVSPENERLLHRTNIYGSGPPIEEAGIQVSDLLHTYLPAGASAVDARC